ncbi:MAG TPA: hypothetical protein VLE91_01145 [Candidatus Saccharimonadales bacterium]|nr:hypothetical protein [Candidatus Saccharimonadales bacterium]
MENGKYRLMFTSVGTLLKTLPKRSKIPDAVLAIHIRSAFDDALKATCSDLPAAVLTSIHALSFKNKVLTISSPRLVSVELSMRSGKLLGEVNKILGRRVVLRLRFKTA